MQSRWLLLATLVFLVAACGGGGGGGARNQAPGPDLVSVAVFGPAAPVPGGGSTQIDVVVANASGVPAANVAATLNLGSGLTKGVVTCAAQTGAACPANPDALSIPTLPAGGSLRFAITASIAAGASGPITNTVSVTADGDGVTANNAAQVVINAYSADLRVTSDSAGGEFYSGSLASYTMTLANLGPDDARDVTVQTVAGPGQVLSSVTCVASGATCPQTAGAVMTIGVLPNGGSLTFTVSASIAADTIGAISNTLYVSAAGDAISSNNVVTSSATARIPTSPQSLSFVTLESDYGDYIGGGLSYSYDRTNALINVSASGGTLSVNIDGEQSWNATFVLPSSQTQLTVGTYSNLRRFPFHDAAAGGLSWSGEGRGCNTLTGSFTIDEAVYVAGSLSQLDLRFEQHCEGGAPALRGQVHWNANDSTRPPGPVNPPPTGLWQPLPGATPATGNYLYLQSDGGDYVGGGGTYTYTQANAVLTLTATANHLTLSVVGNESWYGDLQAMNVVSRFEPGYYGNLQRYPFHNPTVGGLSWSGQSRGCNTLTGWFAIDSVTYSGSSMTSLDARFEQHCEGQAPALRGKIHWSVGDTTQPNGPQVPPPASLWTPAPGATPATGNYVYLQSQAGDYIGGGRAYTYTQADAVLNVSTIGARLNVIITGDESWTGTFQGMSSLTELLPGYYGGLQRWPFHNPVLGGMTWYGEGRGCNTLTGWFVVDGIGYSNGTLASIDLRFEQHCEGGGPALRGQVHWTSDDPTQPPGPQTPPPTDLWAPAPGATPSTGSYVYLASTSGDFIGAGRTYTYTGANAILNATWAYGALSVSVDGDENWSGNFAGMNTLERLEPGYYPNLERYPFHNPVRGGLSWSGEGRGCNTLTGWFVIDSIVYSGGAIEAVELRFEQRCDGGQPLRGAVRWDASDASQPPGPQQPPPASLWQPAPGATPASGNYVYLVSDMGDYIGQGQTYTITPASHTVALNTSGARFYININGPTYWYGEFQGMSSITELEPGYYPDLQRYPFHNPARGGLSWSGQGRGCNTLTGWFVVDSVTYSAGVLASIDLRFEQHCDGSTPALRGEIHWIR